jgi:hypothetical protein
MHWSSADFSGSFRPKGKSRKTFDNIESTKSLFNFKFRFDGGGGGMQTGSPSPHPLGAALRLGHHHYYS